VIANMSLAGSSGFRNLRSVVASALEQCEFVWPAKIMPSRIALSLEPGQLLDLPTARKLASVAKSNPQAQLAAGRAFLMQSGHTVSVIVEAEKCFRRAVSKLPGNAEALTYLAWSIDNQGRWTEAKELYEQAIRLDPGCALARERHDAALEELNLTEVSGEAGRKSTSTFPRFPETIGSLSDMDQAIKDHVLSHTPKDALSLTRETRIVTLGSCFAANLAHALVAEGIAATNLTVGETVNSTYANLQLFQWALGTMESASEEFVSRFGRAELAKLITEADVVIYTLGVAPCFFDKQSGEFVLVPRRQAVRGLRDGRYIFRTTTVEENERNLTSIVALVRRFNPACRFVFSLSPVPLTATLEARSAFEADCLSKSILRVTVDRVASSTPGCLYWPSFEIVRWLGAYLPGMYGEEDGTTHHVSERVVRTIMRLFLDTYRREGRPHAAPV
jgi:hypothetical protein